MTLPLLRHSFLIAFPVKLGREKEFLAQVLYLQQHNVKVELHFSSLRSDITEA